MSPIIPTDVENSPPMTDAGTGQAPPVGTTATPAPTKVGAYRSRGIRSKQSPLDIVSVALRIATFVFTLIAFSVIASDTITFYDAVTTDLGFNVDESITVHFNNVFFFSYLLTANVLAFVWAIVSIVLALLLLNERFVSDAVLIVIFALDLMLSYLLMSASTSAATGVRIDHYGLPGSYLSKAYAAIAFGYLAFFALAGAALLSGFRAARHGRNV